MLVGAPSALASPPASADSAATNTQADQCPAVFGDRQVRAHNGTARRGQLDWIEEDESGVTIVHANERWDDPFRLSIRGVRLVRVDSRAAVFELSAQVATQVRCRAGLYALGVDDGVSRRTRILALLKHGVLVEHRGRLAFIAPSTVASPRWLVAWRMPGEIQAGSGGSPGYQSGRIGSVTY